MSLLDYIGANGETVGDYIKTATFELFHDDSIGMWEIVPRGRQSLGLDGELLDEFVRLYLLENFKAGGILARGIDFPDGSWIWERDPQFGDQPDEVANALVQEWRAMGAPDPEWDWRRIMLPKYFGILRRRPD